MFDTLFTLAQDSGMFTKPIWEDPDRLMSPGVLGLMGVAFALWKVFKTSSSPLQKIQDAIAILSAAGFTIGQSGQPVSPPVQPGQPVQPIARPVTPVQPPPVQ